PPPTSSPLALSAAGNGDNGDSITVAVTPNDGTVDGSAFTSSTATVANSAPAVTGVSVTPASPTTDQTLTATPSSTDADGDTVTYRHQWTKNGSAISGATSATLDLSAAGNGDQNDAITVAVTPSDGAASGSAFTSSPV